MSCQKHEIRSSVVIAGNTNILMAHVVDADNTDLTQAAVESIRVGLYELDDDERTNVDLDGVEIADDAADLLVDLRRNFLRFDKIKADARSAPLAPLVVTQVPNVPPQVTLHATDPKRLCDPRHVASSENPPAAKRHKNATNG